MKNVTAFTLIFAVSCLLLALTACDKDTDATPPPQKAASEYKTKTHEIKTYRVKATPKNKKIRTWKEMADCDMYTLYIDGQERRFCHDYYTDLKSAIEDSDAIYKRIDFECNFRSFKNGIITCDNELGHTAKFRCPEDFATRAIRKKRGDILLVNMAITDTGTNLVIGQVFSLFSD